MMLFIVYLHLPVIVWVSLSVLLSLAVGRGQRCSCPLGSGKAGDKLKIECQSVWRVLVPSTTVRATGHMVLPVQTKGWAPPNCVVWPNIQAVGPEVYITQQGGQLTVWHSAMWVTQWQSPVIRGEVGMASSLENINPWEERKWDGQTLPASPTCLPPSCQATTQVRAESSLCGNWLYFVHFPS